MRLLKTLWIVALAAVLMAALGCGPSAPPEGTEKAAKTEEPKAAPPPAEAPAAEAPPAEETAKVEPLPVPKEAPKAVEQPKAAPKAISGKPVVVMETSKGTIKIELDADKAPITVKNFLAYVDSKFFDGTIFHRVIPGFMIQGGGFQANMNEKSTRPPIQNESSNGLLNARGTLAMARTGDPHSATAQFFINHVNNTVLDKANSRDGWGYAVFGKVIEGMDVVDAIAKVPTTTKGMYENVPAEPVVIKSARRAS
jgi:peptidyl-prolyl cis-trans isomerase A (cyclophilin A)